MKFILFTILLLNTLCLGQTALPPNFEGDSRSSMVHLAGEAKRYFESDHSINKDEFETTSQFQARRAKAEKEKEESEEKFKKLFVAVINKQEFTYNADTKKLNIQTGINSSSAFSFAVPLESRSSSESYTGTNLFGVQKTVSKISSESYQLIFNSTEETAPVMGVDFEMEIEKAKDLKYNLRTAIYFELEYPFLEGQVITDKPTINSPYDINSLFVKIFARAKKILFFNQKNGEVLAIREINY